MRRLVALGALFSLVSAGAVGVSSARAATASPGDPVIAAAGDIACSPSDPNFNNRRGTATACRMMATSDLLVGHGYAGVLALGDDQYNGGSYSDFLASYDPTWGRVKSITRSVAGNHEYGSAGAGGYFRYFGAASGTPGEGWYSYDIGSWHIIALNSNCTAARGGCGTGSPQEQWLSADLAAHASNPCTLAMFHHGRYNSGHDGDSTFMSALFQDLYNAGADVVLSGHAHDYERFAPQDNASHLDTARGVRQFIVGTGGAFFTGWPGGRHANSQASQNNTYGVLQMTLHPGSYDWGFVPTAGGRYTDAGTTACHKGGTRAASSNGPSWPGWDIARGVALTSPNSGYVLDGYGGLHPFATRSGTPPPAVASGPYWPGWDIARGVALLPNGTGGYVLDGYGGMHPFKITGSMPAAVTNADYWPGWNIARGVTATGANGGYVIDGWGGTHPWARGSAARPPAAQGGPYWPGWDIARGIAGSGAGRGSVPGYVVDGYGGLQPITLSAAP